MTRAELQREVRSLIRTGVTDDAKAERAINRVLGVATDLGADERRKLSETGRHERMSWGARNVVERIRRAMTAKPEDEL